MENLDKILKSQKGYLDRTGIGYIAQHSSKPCENLFEKMSATSITCNYCCKVGHYAHRCLYRNNISKSKMIWVPKGTIATNLEGPKKMWVPKTTLYSDRVAATQRGKATETQSIEMQDLGQIQIRRTS